MKTATKRRMMERKIVERLLLGTGTNEICRKLKVGKKRARTTRERALEAGYLDGTREIPAYPEALFPDVADGRSMKQSGAWKELEPHMPWIKERLENGWHKGPQNYELWMRDYWQLTAIEHHNRLRILRH